jgi:hypothetical protein
LSVVPFQNLPMADREREWDGGAAVKRIRAWAGAQDQPNDRYRRAFVWYDAANKDNFSSYKLAIADVIDGKLKAVPRAIISAAGVMQGARGGANLPEKDVERVKSHLARYYRKMHDKPPWDTGS